MVCKTKFINFKADINLQRRIRSLFQLSAKYKCGKNYKIQ